MKWWDINLHDHPYTHIHEAEHEVVYTEYTQICISQVNIDKAEKVVRRIKGIWKLSTYHATMH